MAWICCGKSDPAKETSNALGKQIKKWYKDYDKAIKILLLGAGETGKTTILKQMKILHVNGFSHEERKEKAREIKQNILQGVLEILETMSIIQPNIVLNNPANRESARFMQNLKTASKIEFSQEFFHHAMSLRDDSGFQDCLARANQFPILDCVKYFLEKLETIRRDDYLPSDQDILQSRRRTTDIQKMEFSVKVKKQYGGGTQRIWMFDVGGQRGERKKWIQVFEGIAAILFIVASNSFDSHIREDIETNALKESLILFEIIWNSRYLKDSGVILFLNKQDLLKEKVSKGISIADYYEAYKNYKLSGKEGRDEYHRTRCFIKDMFLDITKKQQDPAEKRKSDLSFNATKNERYCFFHFTVATDTNNVKNVFDDVHSMIIYHNLSKITPA